MPALPQHTHMLWLVTDMSVAENAMVVIPARMRGFPTSPVPDCIVQPIRIKVLFLLVLAGVLTWHLFGGHVTLRLVTSPSVMDKPSAQRPNG